MLTRLHLENFRGLRRLSIDGLKPVSAFLGPNSSGKTTALHAVRLACELFSRALGSDSPAKVLAEGLIEVTKDTLLDSPSTLIALADWQALFTDQVVGGQIRFVIELGFEATPLEQLRVEVACARNQQLKLAVQVRARDALAAIDGIPLKSSLRNQRLTEFLSQHAPRAVLIPPFYGTVPTEELRNRANVDRLLGSGDQSHVVRNLVVALNERDFQGLNTFLADAIGGDTRLIRRTSGDALSSEPSLRVHFQDNNGPLELSAAGAGLVNLIALYAALARHREEAARRPVIFLMDEPEAHLHPRLQAESAARLGALVTQEFGAQLLFATHSVDILNRLSLDGALLIRCDRRATPSARVLSRDAELFTALREWADLTPYTALNALASRRLLFCEGKGDLKTLSRLAALRFRNDLAGRAAFERWALIELAGVGNERLPTLLAQLLESDAIRTAQPLTDFQVVQVLDRDWQRTPGVTESQTPRGLRLKQRVYSRHSIESLFLEPNLLTAWVRAFAGNDAPAELPALIEAALAATDQDERLNEQAQDQLTLALNHQALTDDAGQPLTGDRKLTHAMAAARQRVRAEPGVWQRGKDRARAVLGRLKEALPPPTKNRFPTDILTLIEKTDLDRLPNPTTAIPAELLELLNALSQP